ncbi:hypothetical protein D3C83_163870 [compost metagenome]
MDLGIIAKLTKSFARPLKLKFGWVEAPHSIDENDDGKRLVFLYQADLLLFAFFPQQEVISA